MIPIPLAIAVAFPLTWNDPDNRPETIAGYHVYRVEWTGTGTQIRTRVNAELIPWQPDTDKTPVYQITGAQPGDEYRGTAVGKPEIYPEDQRESLISDDKYVVPFPPAAVPGLSATTTAP